MFRANTEKSRVSRTAARPTRSSLDPLFTGAEMVIIAEVACVVGLLIGMFAAR